MVCASSNSACDEITERLLKVLRNGELHRIYAKSHNKSLVSDTIRPISNQKGDVFKIPTLKYIYKFRVVVCTLITASCFARSNENPEYKSNHFSHVIIDEAACTTEPVTMIAIAGFCLYCLNKLIHDINSNRF